MVKGCSGGFAILPLISLCGLKHPALSPRSLLFSPSHFFLFCPSSHSVMTEQKEDDFSGTFRGKQHPEPHPVWCGRIAFTQPLKPNTGTLGFLLLSHFGFLSWCAHVCVSSLSLFHFSLCDP